MACNAEIGFHFMTYYYTSGSGSSVLFSSIDWWFVVEYKIPIRQAHIVASLTDRKHEFNEPKLTIHWGYVSLC